MPQDLIFGGTFNISETVPVAPQIGILYGGKAQLEIKFASIDVNAGVTGTIVTGVSGKQIVVLHLVLCALDSGGATVGRYQFRSNATALHGRMHLPALATLDIKNDHGIFKTVAGDPLNLNLSNGASDCDMSGYISYVEF